MPGQTPPRRHSPKRVFQYLPRVILNSLMSVAVTVLERRIRKALRSNAESGRQSGHESQVNGPTLLGSRLEQRSGRPT